MKKIICYGDSNTFGFNTTNFSRYDENTRWTSVLQNNLGSDYEVINEGLCDRMGFVDNPKGSSYSSQKHFPEFIKASENFDLLVLWVGTNDLQFQYNIDFETVKSGLKNLIDIAKEKTGQILIIPPVVLDEMVLKGFFNFQFNEESIVKSKKIGETYKQISKENGCDYFDINEVTKPFDFDGLHYDENSHKLIADKLTEFIKTQYNF